jgi:lipopolysaccharide/colanic/teichoic acid biosynthesis glycosyltransferase
MMSSQTSHGSHQRRSILVSSGARSRARDLAKRSMDVLIAGVAVAVLLPFMLAIWAAIRLTSPGGAIFKQTRLGADRCPFIMYKFRSMKLDSDDRLHREYVARLLTEEIQPVDGLYKLTDDPRITAVGAFLRKTSLDELPQLFNVLSGELSLVGPRPALAWEATLFPAWADARFQVKPGVTGLWQVSGRNRVRMTDGLRLDVDYVARRSLWLDLRILLRTIPAVLSGGAR